MTKPFWCSVCDKKHASFREAIECFQSHTPNPALTGGSVAYYKVRVDQPTSGGKPYTAECNDIIEALKMEYDVANAFKAAWRVAALRQGRGKPGQDSERYDGEKIVFFGQRIVARSEG